MNGRFSGSLKQADKTHGHKKEDLTDISSFCPMSVVPSLSKVESWSSAQWLNI